MHKFQEGLKTQTIHREWDYTQQKWSDTTKTVFGYNNNDSLIKKTVQVPKNDGWQDSSQVLHHYEEALLSSIAYKIYKNEEWKYLDSTDYSYDLDKKQCIILNLEWENGSWMKNRRWILDYLGETDKILPAEDNWEYKLSQAYPNPFNSSTRIEYYLKNKAQVKISVYNIKGQKVAKLVNSIKSQGSHTLNWNPKNIPSGIYFYRINSENFTEVKKCIYLK